MRKNIIAVLMVLFITCSLCFAACSDKPDDTPTVEPPVITMLDGSEISDFHAKRGELNEEKLLENVVVTMADGSTAKPTVSCAHEDSTKTDAVDLTKSGTYVVTYSYVSEVYGKATAIVKAFVYSDINLFYRGDINEETEIAVKYSEALESNDFSKFITIKDSNGNPLTVTKTGNKFNGREGAFDVTYSATDKSGQTLNRTIKFIVTNDHAISVENNTSVFYQDTVLEIPASYGNETTGYATNLWLENADGDLIETSGFDIKSDKIIIKASLFRTLDKGENKLVLCSTTGAKEFTFELDDTGVPVFNLDDIKGTEFLGNQAVALPLPEKEVKSHEYDYSYTLIKQTDYKVDVNGLSAYEPESGVSYKAESDGVTLSLLKSDGAPITDGFYTLSVTAENKIDRTKKLTKEITLRAFNDKAEFLENNPVRKVIAGGATLVETDGVAFSEKYASVYDYRTTSSIGWNHSLSISKIPDKLYSYATYDIYVYDSSREVDGDDKANVNMNNSHANNGKANTWFVERDSGTEVLSKDLKMNTWYTVYVDLAQAASASLDEKDLNKYWMYILGFNDPLLNDTIDLKMYITEVNYFVDTIERKIGLHFISEDFADCFKTVDIYSKFETYPTEITHDCAIVKKMVMNGKEIVLGAELMNGGDVTVTYEYNHSFVSGTCSECGFTVPVTPDFGENMLAKKWECQSDYWADMKDVTFDGKTMQKHAERYTAVADYSDIKLTISESGYNCMIAKFYVDSYFNPSIDWERIRLYARVTRSNENVVQQASWINDSGSLINVPATKKDAEVMKRGQWYTMVLDLSPYNISADNVITVELLSDWGAPCGISMYICDTYLINVDKATIPNGAMPAVFKSEAGANGGVRIDLSGNTLSENFYLTTPASSRAADLQITNAKGYDVFVMKFKVNASGAAANNNVGTKAGLTFFSYIYMSGIPVLSNVILDVNGNVVSAADVAIGSWYTIYVDLQNLNYNSSSTISIQIVPGKESLDMDIGCAYLMKGSVLGENVTGLSPAGNASWALVEKDGELAYLYVPNSTNAAAYYRRLIAKYAVGATTISVDFKYEDWATENNSTPPHPCGFHNTVVYTDANGQVKQASELQKGVWYTATFTVDATSTELSMYPLTQSGELVISAELYIKNVKANYPA